MLYPPGIHDHVTNEDYHSQRDALSSSGARLLVQDGGPQLFKYRQDNPEQKDAYDIGTVFHSVTLEDSLEGVREVEAENWMTKVAKEAKATARAEGKIPMLTKDLAKVNAMRDAVMAHPRARRLLEFGEVEQSMFAEVEGVKVRSRPDKWTAEHPDEGPVILDLKSTTDASYQGFQKSSGDFGYFQQDPWYRDVLEAITGIQAKFYFVAVEKSPPYRVNVLEHHPVAIEGGRAVNAHAMNVFKRCTDTGEWPGYGVAAPVELKPWDESRIDQILED